MAFWRLFRVFFWKNLLFVYFNLFTLILIFTGCAGILVVYLKSTYQLFTTPDYAYDAKDTMLLKEYFPANEGDYLVYTPEDPFLHTLMENVRQDMQLPAETLKAFPNPTEMKAFLESSRGNTFGIQYYGMNENPQNYSLQFSISSTSLRISPKKRYVNDEEVSGIKDDDDYIRTGFLTLQHIIDKNYIKLRHNSFEDFSMEIAALPSIAMEAIDSQRVILFGSMYSVLFSVLLLSTFLVPLVEEKQNGLKEFLVIATPLNFLNGFTFFLIRLMLYLCFLIVALITASTDRTLGTVPLAYVFVLFMLYMLSAMSYAYLISVCFNSVFYAKVGGVLLLFTPYIFYLLNGTFSNAATVLFSTKSFMDGVEILQIYTNKHRCFTFSALTLNITESSFSILSIYGFLVLQCLINMLLYNYLSCIFPGPGGLKKPYAFLLNSSFYKKKQRNQYTTSERGTDAIIIQDLVKKFNTPTRQIHIADHLNMVIKNKQITVLLGHNGAGKTTTLNMIMGSVPKDSGKIIVCSERDVTSYRHLIGFCPQQSVFMHYMTCEQHLQFFSRLRGISKKEAISLSQNLLSQLKLESKSKVYGKQLSGGMKRRLSLGIAISGDTKVIILDEPSSGLDIESRRELWDILLRLRKTKAVLVTTHHMEEAEVLGDTICILANGRLLRTGSPLELKRRAGSGYILKLCTDIGKYEESHTLDLIGRHFPEAKILNVVPPSVIISLPYCYKSKYSEMLKDLEGNLCRLGINSISITDTSLEDVFLNCASEVDQVDSVNGRNEDNKQIFPYQPLDKSVHLNWLQQFMAVWYKKCIYLQNEWRYTLFMALLPFISISLAIFLMHSTDTVTSEDKLSLNLDTLRAGIIYIHRADDGNEYTNKIENVLIDQIQRHHIQAKRLELHGNNTVVKELFLLQIEDLAHFLQNVIGLIDVRNDEEKSTISLYYSGNIYHSSVILTNLIDNVMLKVQASNEKEINTIYAPIRRFITDVSPTRLEYYAVIVPIGFFFYMFFYISLPFKEKMSGFKNLQAIPRLTYWIAMATFDLSLHFLICVLLFIFQIWLMPKELYSQQEQILIICTVFFYGLSYLPILYSCANSCRSISTISTYLLFMLIISAIVPLITSGNVSAMNYHETKILFLSLLPDFNLNHHLRVINENFIINRQKTTIKANLSTGTFFIDAVFIFIFGMFVFVCIVENKEKREAIRNLFQCYSCGQVSTKLLQPEQPKEEEECLVQKEKDMVKEILEGRREENYPLLVSNLKKYYERQPAVCGLSFVVQKQECFGLLGVNGAGKTSTFQMITANKTITSGNIKIDGCDIRENEDMYKYRFGYCPQNDCLNNFMTAYQTLSYMARLRGVRQHGVDNEVNYWLEKLDLQAYTNVQIRHYSGGTKRKLSAAVAMIGSPSLVLLDEPTTGVDPVSRRFLWKCIQEFQRRDKTIVLTSHSMDECEQLCNRLAIMAEGKFKCLGNIPDLKDRFGLGFTVKVKMISEDSTEEVRKVNVAFQQQFPEQELRENHAGMLTYFVRNINHIPWSRVYSQVEKFANECSQLIEDYSINECTLEDIFLKFNTNSSKLRSTEDDRLISSA